MDQVIRRQRQRGTTTTTTRKKRKECCFGFDSPRQETSTKIGTTAKRKIIEDHHHHQEDEQTIVAPSNPDNSFDTVLATIIKKTGRKWIFEEEEEEEEKKWDKMEKRGLDKLPKLNCSYKEGDDDDNYNGRDLDFSHLRKKKKRRRRRSKRKRERVEEEEEGRLRISLTNESLKMVLKNEKEVIQNQCQQIDCPGEKEAASRRREKYLQQVSVQEGENNDDLEDEEEKEDKSKDLTLCKDNFLLLKNKIRKSSSRNVVEQQQQERYTSRIGGRKRRREFSSCCKIRGEIRVVDKTVSYLFLTLLIIIARQFYTQIRCNLPTTFSDLHLLNDHTTAPTKLINQRCLPDLVLIRSCFAASTTSEIVPATTEATTATATATFIETTNNTTTTITVPANETLETLNVTLEKGVTVTEAAQRFAKPTLNLSLINTTTDAAMEVEPNTSNNRTTIDYVANNATTVTATTTTMTTDHRHQIYQSQQQLSVLCNSRCNCVVLEPVFSKSGFGSGASLGIGSQVSGKPPPAGTKETTEQEQTTVAVATTTTTLSSESQTNNTTASSEEALIAFNEDYSLDYEQPLSSYPTTTPMTTTTTTTTTEPAKVAITTATMPTNGNEPNNDDLTSVKAASATKTSEPTSTSLAGNDRAKAGENIALNASLEMATKLSLDSKAKEENNNNEIDNISQPAIDSASPTTTTNQAKNDNTVPAASTSTIQVNFTNNPINNTTTTTTTTTNLSDVAGSSRQSQPLQTKQTITSGVGGGDGGDSKSNNTTFPNLNKQTNQLQQKQQQQQQQGMTLFPIPSPHLHHLHHHHHHHQPLGAGAGRDSSGPQLYAQSLYSSQAPKLSYHAHTPYLKTSPSSMTTNGNNNNPISEFNANGDKIYQDQSSLLNAFSSNTPLTSVGGPGIQNSPLQYHHMRSNYVTHHLRLQQQQQQQQVSNQASSLSGNNSPISNNFIASKTNHVFPQQFILVPLKTMNMSQKLNFSSPQQRNNTNNNNNNNDNDINQNNEYYQDIEQNWKDYPELIEKIELMLNEVDKNQIQSLNLSYNELQFELWSELYALLAIQMRQHLFHLDLSHNSLIKLGITFTGYIEHHIAAHNGWPIQQQQLSQTATTTNNQSQLDTKYSNSPVYKSPKGGSKNPLIRMRHSLFSGGKLYNLIKDKRQQKEKEKEINIQQNKGYKVNNNITIRQHNNNNSSTSSSSNTLLQQALLIKALDLSHNKLKWLIKDQFRALKHVQTIRLDYNRIRYIHQHAFSGLESLRFLNLNFNRLQVIYIEQFQTNYNLLALMLRSNYLAYLRGGSFASLANLKRLDLSSNKLTIVSNNAFLGLESLELLNCSSNQFVHAPSASLHSLTSLKKLDLSDNLIAQLAPGTFFHLPIEELWLNQNEQMVAIDRGAFWDLPYLRRLHLRSNPMLMSINSQAFVGTQNLLSIDVEYCQSLDESAKQMLENITMAATSRLLRYSEQQQQQQSINNINNNNNNNRVENNISPKKKEPISSLDISSSSDSTTIETETTTSPNIVSSNNSSNNSGQSIQLVADSSNTKQTSLGLAQENSFPLRQHSSTSTSTSSSHQINQQQILGSNSKESNRLRYIYYASVLTFLVVALKLVFKYTSTSHYMETRRRRRRVYEAANCGNKNFSTNSTSSNGNIDCFTDTDLDGNSISSSNVDAFPMCVQPESHLFGLGNTLSVINNNNNNNSNNNNINDQHNNNGVVDENNVENSEQQQQQMIGECLSSQHESTGNGGIELADNEQQQQQVVSEHGEAPSVDINVISNSVSSVIPISSPSCCPDCPQQQQQQAPNGGLENGDSSEQQQQQQQQVVVNCDQTNQHLPGPPQAPPNHPTFDLIHSQLVAAGFDYGHANCAHFYQSLGPALQLADITANFVNNMDYY